MKLSDTTFVTIIATLKKAYLNWELPEQSIETWKNILALSVSDELLPRIVLDWVSNKTTAPKSPAELIQYGRNRFNAQYDSADTAADLIITSARDAYYVTDDFEDFTIEYENSFEAAISGRPAQEAYIVNTIKEHSSNPKVLIMVYDELKGEVQDCFTGDAENGVEFLRNHIKKSWTKKIDEVAKDFLVSGNSIKRLGDNIDE